MNNVLCLFAVIILFISCKSEQQNNKYKNKEYYKNGDLKKEILLNGVDSSFGSIEKYYNPNKVLEHEIEYKNGKKNGIEKYYYKNGTLEEVSNWLNGFIFGESIQYFSNKKIETYKYYGLGSELIYIRKYNNKNEIIKEEGKPILLFYNKNKLKINDKLEIKLLFGLLPNCIFRIQFHNLSNARFKNIITINNKDSLGRSVGSMIYIFHTDCDKIGNFKLGVSLIISDTLYNRKIEYLDTLQYSVMDNR